MYEGICHIYKVWLCQYVTVGDWYNGTFIVVRTIAACLFLFTTKMLNTTYMRCGGIH